MEERYDRHTDLNHRLSSSLYILLLHYLRVKTHHYFFSFHHHAIADGCNHRRYCYCNGLAVRSTAVLVIAGIRKINTRHVFDCFSLALMKLARLLAVSLPFFFFSIITAMISF